MDPERFKPLHTDKDAVSRLLSGEAVETYDVPTFLVLKARLGELELLDAENELIPHELKQDMQELVGKTFRTKLRIRLKTTQFRKRLKAVGDDHTEEGLLRFFIENSQRTTQAPLGESLGDVLDTPVLKSIVKSLGEISAAAERAKRRMTRKRASQK